MEFHKFDLRQEPRTNRYKLLSSLIVPRPIAWVTTRSADGAINCAPYSFFNCFGSEPPLVVVAPGNRPDNGQPKDTAANIIATEEFVVNLVPDELAEAMNATAASHPHGVNELKDAGLSWRDADEVKPPLINGCLASLECKLLDLREYGANRLVMGEVLVVHAARHALDAEKLYVNTNVYHPIGRLAGTAYCRTHETFNLDRPG